MSRARACRTVQERDSFFPQLADQPPGEEEGEEKNNESKGDVRIQAEAKEDPGDQEVWHRLVPQRLPKGGGGVPADQEKHSPYEEERYEDSTKGHS